MKMYTRQIAALVTLLAFVASPLAAQQQAPASGGAAQTAGSERKEAPSGDQAKKEEPKKEEPKQETKKEGEKKEATKSDAAAK